MGQKWLFFGCVGQFSTFNTTFSDFSPPPPICSLKFHIYKTKNHQAIKAGFWFAYSQNLLFILFYFILKQWGFCDLSIMRNLVFFVPSAFLPTSTRSLLNISLVNLSLFTTNVLSDMNSLLWRIVQIWPHWRYHNGYILWQFAEATLVIQHSTSLMFTAATSQ